MHLVNNSITIVLIGDWNKLYTQPDWIANNVYETPEIEIGIEVQNTDFHVTYRKDNVGIRPSQSKMVFSATDSKAGSLAFLAKCVNNYLHKAVTPTLTAFGFNADYEDSEDVRLADVFDHMTDTCGLLDLGYEISASQVSRSLSKDGKTLIMKCAITNTQTTISFNEHHASPEMEHLEITMDMIESFLHQTQEIIAKAGYKLDGGKDE